MLGLANAAEAVVRQAYAIAARQEQPARPVLPHRMARIDMGGELEIDRIAPRPFDLVGPDHPARFGGSSDRDGPRHQRVEEPAVAKVRDTLVVEPALPVGHGSLGRTGAWGGARRAKKSGAASKGCAHDVASVQMHPAIPGSMRLDEQAFGPFDEQAGPGGDRFVRGTAQAKAMAAAGEQMRLDRNSLCAQRGAQQDGFSTGTVASSSAWGEKEGGRVCGDVEVRRMRPLERGARILAHQLLARARMCIGGDMLTTG
ncbi:hypothetical protein DdX_22226 [Ditylenchus destructor]|uniref:Uncharacterized protein n=1 Tax=Ditylenchus destructor TaxID=166010 RepID=A0AAD4MI98_9BILA|nr:hypothetical protein DdX_22226 [Ditylenchus destructor]